VTPECDPISHPRAAQLVTCTWQNLKGEDVCKPSAGKLAVDAWELCATPRGFHFYILSELAYHAQCEIWWKITLRE